MILYWLLLITVGTNTEQMSTQSISTCTSPLSRASLRFDYCSISPLLQSACKPWLLLNIGIVVLPHNPTTTTSLRDARVIRPSGLPPGFFLLSSNQAGGSERILVYLPLCMTIPNVCTAPRIILLGGEVPR